MAKSRASGKSTKAGLQTELWQRPGYLIRRLHQIHVAMFIEECAAFGITPVQYAVMTVLLNNPGLGQVSIANEAGIDRTNVADVLARLEDRGLVRRRTGTDDRRVKLAYLTDEGDRVAHDMEASVLRAQDRLVAPLSTDERGRLMEMMAKLVDDNNEYSRAPAKGR